MGNKSGNSQKAPWVSKAETQIAQPSLPGWMGTFSCEESPPRCWAGEHLLEQARNLAAWLVGMSLTGYGPYWLSSWLH